MESLTKLYNEHQKTVLFSSAAAVRILLALTFPSLADLLAGRVEISTPVNSFKRCTHAEFAQCNGLIG
jgi:GPI-anchor transamidase subunit U